MRIMLAKQCFLGLLCTALVVCRDSGTAEAGVWRRSHGGSTTEGQPARNRSELREVLKQELGDENPEVHETIASSIDRSRLDRSKYRDLFLIRKHTVTDDEHKIVTYNIEESIIPLQTPELPPSDRTLKGFLLAVLFLLTALVTTTSIRLFQSLAHGQRIGDTKCECVPESP